MTRILRATRYLDDENRELARAAVEDLPYMDMEEALEFYAIHHDMGLRNKDAALLGANDRFYLFTQILGRVDGAHPWLYDRCREVEANPDGYLDLWAREHYKSTLITYAGIIQELMADPELCACIFSFRKSIAQKFLGQIMRDFERNQLLKDVYEDVLWQRPRVEAPLWSRSDGIVIKRAGNPSDPSILASGLVDGMPTGGHFGLMVYDDVVTDKSVTNPEMVAATTEAWELSDNLGAGDVRVWHAGTRYCTVGAMRITMSDWSQRPIEEVKIGDEVVGWEQVGGQRVLRRAKVINRGVHRQQPVNRYTFNTGRSVTCTADHKWWRGPWGSGAEYNHLQIPRRPERSHIKVIGKPDLPAKAKGMSGVRQLLVPTQQLETRDAGWIAGMYDGEGTFKKNPNHPSGAAVITQSMLNPHIINELRAAFTRLRFEFSEAWWKATDTNGDKRDRMTHDRCNFLINGGWSERYRFLVEINPTKRQPIADSLFAKLTTEGLDLVQVEAQEPQDVHWLETETGNYVVEGLCSSNSFADTYGQIMERGALIPRIYPATHDGTMNGRLVFMSEKRWQDKVKKQRSTLAAQMLQNPLSGKENMFEPQWIARWEVRPEVMNVYIMVDPSSGRHKQSDRTAMAVIGVGASGKKYLLDGVCHRMALSERWTWLRMFYIKWSAARGVRLIKVGYERYGLQSDIEHFNLEMQKPGEVQFEIIELNTTADGVGNQGKKSRVGRLEPDVRLGNLLLPAMIAVPGQGDCFWSISKTESRIVVEPVERVLKNGEKIRGVSRNMKAMIDRGFGHLTARPIERKNEDGKPYDATRTLVDEMIFFPFAPRDDFVDCVSRIFDMGISTPDPNDVMGGDHIEFTEFEDA